MEIFFRLFMYIFPYAIAVVLYIWMLKKALRTPNKIARAVAVTIVVAGFSYTLFKIAKSIPTALTNENFEYIILIVTTIILFFASIAMALGEPEKK